MSTNFHLAPPSKVVDGLMAVPIDIQSIEAIFTFDGAAETAFADATIRYAVGPIAGNPIFDLRQNISQAWLDNVLFPVDRLVHHNFGNGPFSDLRVIESAQPVGSVHTLRVQYNLGNPDSQLGGSYLPILEWSAGPKLLFVFGLSDLNRARYIEAWLPANLIFDQYCINLEIQIVNTIIAHSIITNGIVTSLGLNHWRISFPSRSSALSPLLEVRASDTLTQQTDTVMLPISGKTVTIETWKPKSSMVNLTTQINNIKTFLADNENNYGAYVHDEHFVAFFNGTGGMEYEGGTTTSTDALLHETFHSWFARGIKPASQADGWYDEGFTVFHDNGADDASPFDFSDPPILLCSRDPWQRHTPSDSYSDGSRFWRGMASLLSIANLNSLMANFYEKYRGQPSSSQMLEEFLLSKTGNTLVVDAFHRFVYGFSDPSPAAELWLRDNPSHAAGSDQWNGPFWDSPDLWIRNNDDGGTDHETPVYGQDNWFFARVRNKVSAGRPEHFVVTFHSKGFVGTQFVFPNDFFPCITAKAEFDLEPGATKVVKARWPRELVPHAGVHTSLLASIITRGDRPVTGRHVWQHNNLAQKNLIVLNLLPNTFEIVSVVIGNPLSEFDSRFALELWWTNTIAPPAEISLIHKSKDFFRIAKASLKPFHSKFSKNEQQFSSTRLECGGNISALKDTKEGSIMTSDTPGLLSSTFSDSWESTFSNKRDRSRIAVQIPPFTQRALGIKVAITANAMPEQSFKIHLAQRHTKSKSIVGGVAFRVNIR